MVCSGFVSAASSSPGLSVAPRQHSENTPCLLQITPYPTLTFANLPELLYHPAYSQLLLPGLAFYSTLDLVICLFVVCDVESVSLHTNESSLRVGVFLMSNAHLTTDVHKHQQKGKECGYNEDRVLKSHLSWGLWNSHPHSIIPNDQSESRLVVQLGLSASLPTLIFPEGNF